jgi:hypothetical protein
MQRLLLVLSVLSFAAIANAQENPKYELFGGYSYMHEEFINHNGWEASGAYNFNRWIGLKADVGGHYGHHGNSVVSLSDQVHTFTVGPQFSWRVKRGTLFGHTLFGLAHEHEHERVSIPFATPFNFDASNNSFATILGGGGDWNLTDRFGWRGQIDYLQNSFFGRHENHLRISTGIVYRFGKR